MSEKTSRLFIALPIDESRVAESLGDIYRDLGRYGSILKTVSPANLHITMKFLGDVGEDKSSEMIGSFSSLGGDSRIEYTVKGLGCFPGLSAPSVIWTGIQCDMKKMSDLFLKVEEFCSSFGFEKETRRFTPHLTMARVKRGRDAPAGLKDFIKSNKDKVYCDAVFDRLVLFESRLDSKGPEYTAKAEVKLI